jgi:prepilin-type N-terminal cleavage/methylation domain-containing protein
MRKKAFTLTELLAVITIAALLSTLAAPIYTHQVNKAEASLVHSAVTNTYSSLVGHYQQFGSFEGVELDPARGMLTWDGVDIMVMDCENLLPGGTEWGFRCDQNRIRIQVDMNVDGTVDYFSELNIVENGLKPVINTSGDCAKIIGVQSLNWVPDQF